MRKEKAARCSERPHATALATRQQGADHALDEQGARVHLIEVAIVVIITVVRVQVVTLPQIVRNLPIRVPLAVAAAPSLAAIELLRLAGRHAAVVLLGEPWRAAADAIAVRPAFTEAIGESVAVAMSVARLCKRRRGEAERCSAGDQKCVFHIPLLSSRTAERSLSEMVTHKKGRREIGRASCR